MAEILVVYRSSDSEAANALMEVARAKGITVWHWQYENIETSFDAFLDYVRRNPVDTIIAVGGPGAMPLISGAILPDYLKEQLKQPGNPVYYEMTDYEGKRAVVMAGYDANETRSVVNAALRAVVFALQFPDPGTAAAVYNNFNTIKAWEFLLPYTLDRAELSGSSVIFYCTLKESPMMVTGAAPYVLPVMAIIWLIGIIVATVGTVLVVGYVKDVFTVTKGIADTSSKNMQIWTEMYKNGDLTQKEYMDLVQAEIKFREEAGEDTLKTLIKYLPIILGGMLAISLVSALMPRK